MEKNWDAAWFLFKDDVHIHSMVMVLESAYDLCQNGKFFFMSALSDMKERRKFNCDRIVFDYRFITDDMVHFVSMTLRSYFGKFPFFPFLTIQLGFGVPRNYIMTSLIREDGYPSNSDTLLDNASKEVQLYSGRTTGNYLQENMNGVSISQRRAGYLFKILNWREDEKLVQLVKKHPSKSIIIQLSPYEDEYIVLK